MLFRSASSPCFRKSLTVFPLPQKITHCDPPASENQTHSSPYLRKSLTVIPCLRKSLRVIPLPQKITHTHPTASENQTHSSPCLRKLHTFSPRACCIPRRIPSRKMPLRRDSVFGRWLTQTIEKQFPQLPLTGVVRQRKLFSLFSVVPARRAPEDFL